jgi:hypothetical protein
MRRSLSILAVVALLATLLPASVVAAQNGGGRGAASAARVTVCHSPNGVNPRAITIARSALKAHLAHGDFVVTPEKPCVPKPKAPKATVCTFTAATSQYYAAPVPPATVGALFATGPITFRWNVPTKAAIDGYWDEYTVADPATKLHNVVTAGTVNGTAVSLTFTRTAVPPAPDYVFPFSGTLTSAAPGPATLTGTMAGPTYAFTAAGTVRCSSGDPAAGQP